MWNETNFIGSGKASKLGKTLHPETCRTNARSYGRCTRRAPPREKLAIYAKTGLLTLGDGTPLPRLGNDKK